MKVFTLNPLVSHTWIVYSPTIRGHRGYFILGFQKKSLGPSSSDQNSTSLLSMQVPARDDMMTAGRVFEDVWPPCRWLTAITAYSLPRVTNVHLLLNLMTEHQSSTQRQTIALWDITRSIYWGHACCKHDEYEGVNAWRPKLWHAFNYNRTQTDIDLIVFCTSL